MTLNDFLADWHSPCPTLQIQTSGSTGTPKTILAEKSRMTASAHITCQFLGLQPNDTALLCLPLDFIAGKMMVVRALTCHLQLIPVTPSAHPFATLTTPPTFAAITPMQAFETLKNPTEKQLLSRTPKVIIGGGAINPQLAQQLAHMPNAIYSTYGMTETLSHIALRRLSGPTASEWYTPFPSVSLSLDNRSCLVINAPTVCPDTLTTNDIAQLDPSQRFRIIGRADNVICSGGIKIQAEEVERLLQPHINVPFIITYQPDERLGQALTLLLENGDTNNAKSLCDTLLPRYWRPKHIISLPRLPRTPTGKLKHTPYSPTTPI